MYHVDRRTHRHQRFRKAITWFAIVVLGASSVYILLHVRVAPIQNVDNAPPVSKAYDANTPARVPIDKPEFTLELPNGWTEQAIVQTSTSPRYVMKSPSRDAQQLEIYIDNPPQRFGLNKVVAVDGVGTGVTHGAVSDNCTTYTNATKRDPDTGFAPAKWQGIDFYCDVANPARAVVGTVSNDGFNYFSANGPTFGTHKVFIVYIDNNITPDYTVLYNILNSLKFK